MTDFPPGFFDRSDEHDDDRFYDQPRFVTHIDERAIAAVSALYTELGLTGRVLDLMSSWVSHFEQTPEHLTVLGMNRDELSANPQATEIVVRDVNSDPSLPFDAASFDAVTCCVSVDYLTQPVAVLAEVSRVLRAGAPVVLTYSNRCFPTKAIRGWLATDDATHAAIVTAYLRDAGGFDEAEVSLRTPPGSVGDPLWAVVGRRSTR